MVTTRFVLVLLALGLAACGDNLKGHVDGAPIDAGPDAPPADEGPCGEQRFIGGELLDWDSTSTAFLGVNNAVFTQRGGAATATTPPNGRVEMCVGTTTSYIFDVNAPSTYLDAIAYFDLESVVGSSNVQQRIKMRDLTMARAATFYTERSLVFDASKAHVLVYLAGDVTGITLDVAHGTPQLGSPDASGETITWTSGAGSAKYVLFPNVDASSTSGVIEGDLQGDHSIPLEAGKMTLVSIAWFFL